MKKGEKKKQQKALKKRAQDKLARKEERPVSPMTALRRMGQSLVPVQTSPLSHIYQARQYPFEACWIQKDWKEAGLAVVVVARRQPNGNIVFGNYLVDYYCLGLKNTFCNGDIPPDELLRNVLPCIFEELGTPMKISPDLAHEIIYGAIAYAAQFGFRPQRDFKLSQYILDPPEMHPRTGTVEFGRQGKPFYISGPYDDVDAIMRKLTQKAGPGNFNYLIQFEPPSDDWFDADSEV